MATREHNVPSGNCIKASSTRVPLRKKPWLGALAAIVSLTLFLLLSAACGTEDSTDPTGTDREEERVRSEEGSSGTGTIFSRTSDATLEGTETSNDGDAEGRNAEPTRPGLLGNVGGRATAAVDSPTPQPSAKGGFISVSAGVLHTCEVRADGAVACWGRDVGCGPVSPPKGEFASVSAGDGYSCGVRRDGTVACWGREARGVTQADFE